MTIDCHVHLNDYVGDGSTPQQRVEALVAEMQASGVERAIILTSYLDNDRRPGVETVLELVKPYPQLFVVEGLSMTGGMPLDIAATEERLRSGKTVGLKLYPGYEHFYPTDRVCEPVYEIAARHKVPVMFHSGDTYTKRGKLKYSHPLILDEVAVDHPDVSIVICHLGNPWFRDTAELIYKNDNVRADISGLVLGSFEAKFEKWVADEVRDLIAYAGDPEDLLFGTDWPLVPMSHYLRFVESLGLEEDQMELLLSKNSEEWFRLGRRQA